MSSDTILAIDQGTSCTRALTLLDGLQAVATPALRRSAANGAAISAIPQDTDTSAEQSAGRPVHALGQALA